MRYTDILNEEPEINSVDYEGELKEHLTAMESSNAILNDTLIRFNKAVAIQEELLSRGMSQRLYASMEALDVDLSRFTYSTESIDSSISTRIALESMSETLTTIINLLRKHLDKIIVLFVVIIGKWIMHLRSITDQNEKPRESHEPYVYTPRYRMHSNEPPQDTGRSKGRQELLHEELLTKDIPHIGILMLNDRYPIDNVVPTIMTLLDLTEKAVTVYYVMATILVDIYGHDGDMTNKNFAVDINGYMKELKHASEKHDLNKYCYSRHYLFKELGSHALPILSIRKEQKLDKENNKPIPSNAPYEQGLFYEGYADIQKVPAWDKLFSDMDTPYPSLSSSFNSAFTAPAMDDRRITARLDGITSARKKADTALELLGKLLDKGEFKVDASKASSSLLCWPEAVAQQGDAKEGTAKLSTIMGGRLIRCKLLSNQIMVIKELSNVGVDAMNVAQIAVRTANIVKAAERKLNFKMGQHK